MESPIMTSEQSLSRSQKVSKRDRILELYRSDEKDILKIAEKLSARPSYVAQTLQGAGLLQGYFDLYTSSEMAPNVYAPFFKHVVSFKSVEAAKKSVEEINALYKHFESLEDRAGQHHAMVVALTGMNRARFSHKLEEAEVFRAWVVEHLR